MRRSLTAIACAVVLTAAGHATASTLALAPLADGGFGGAQGLNMGWSFQVTTAIEVTALAYFEDSDPDPLQGAHTVGIWIDGDGTNPLALATVDPGDPVIDFPLSNGTQHYYLQSIAPVLLIPGTTYVVSGTAFATDTVYQAPFFTTGAEIVFGDGRYGSTAGGYAESALGLGWALLGASFLYEIAAAPAPEPGTLALGLVPIAMLGARRRR